MLKNSIIIAWRNLVRYKNFSFINIFGLSIGIASCILVFLFIRDELSYDKQNKDADRIYRVVKKFVNDDGSVTADATTPPAIAIAMQNNIPEVEHVARLFPRGWGNNFYVRRGDKKFIEENICWADSSIFNVFSFPVIKGDSKKALENPDAIILTESIAKKYFGIEDPIGKTLNVDDWQPKIVTAIIKDIPENSHLKIDILLSLKSMDGNNRLSNMWGWYSFYTYVKLKPGSDINVVDKKIRSIFSKSQPENKNYFYSQLLTDIHLHSNLNAELNPNSDEMYIYIFGTIAILILLTACINYINLTTARSSFRSKEIGIRKISGAAKSTLIKQFLVESVICTLLAGVMAIVIAQSLLPSINLITGKQLTLISNGNYLVISSVFCFSIFIGLITGLYPASYLSSLRVVQALKGEKTSFTNSFNVRKILVIIQFTFSISLIIGTIIVSQQIAFIRNAKLGLNKDHVIIVNDIGYLNRDDRTLLKNKFLLIPGVEKVAASDGVIGGLNWTNNIRYKESHNNQLINFLSVDNNFIEALDIQLKEGRNFSQDYPSDTTDAIILNETAAKTLGIPDPVVGQQIVWGENPNTKQLFLATVIGIAKDFHFTSMKNEIKPFAFVTRNNRQWNFTIKMSGANIDQAIANLKETWNQNVKSRPFQFSFLDDTYAKMYKSEMNFKTIFLYITFTAIFIACLGLFGLSSFVTSQRTKEIGIRKVLGATVPGIVGMLSKDFVKLVLISSVIAFPFAWWAMHSWLQNFVYRVDISWWVFALAAIIALLIAFITVSSQAIKAAVANPVKSLRTE
ncbi:MAG: ABC transporter permease [Bacteroidetes bacterium]|nr:ABC transporter permease [Bacteroidota bacterium]